jgi:hypothetical protein
MRKSVDIFVIIVYNSICKVNTNRHHGGKIMEYVVTAWGENDKLIRKTFKYRKSAEKFGVKMVEKYNHCTIHTFSGTELLKSEYY